jgi:hypothetical protein
MAKYNIGGRIIESSAPLTDAEIDEIASSLPAAPVSKEFASALSTAEDVRAMPSSTGEYLVNSAKLAPVSGISSTYGLVRSALDLAGIDPTTSPLEKINKAFTKITQPTSVIDRVAENPLLQATTAGDIITGQKVNPMGDLLTGMQPYQQESLTQLAKLTGGRTDLVAPDLTTKVLGAGIQTALDPTAWGIGSIPKTLGQLSVRPVGLGVVGATSEIGGELGGQVEKAITGEDTGAARAIGSIVTGGATALKGGALVETLGTGYKGAKQVYDKYREIKADPDAAEQAMATGAAKRFLKKVSEGKTVDEINSLMDDFSKISNKITGEDIPLAVSMADNPTMRATVANLVKTNPEFRLRYETEMNKIANAIDKNAETIFGKRYTPIEGVDQVSIKNAVKVRQNIDTELDNIGNRLVGEPVDGARVQNLIDTRIKAARAEQSVEYKSVTDDARKAGAKLPVEGVRDIYNFVKQNRMRDIFGTGTQIDRDIISKFAPDATGFAPVNFDTVVSLKEAINRLQRGRLEPKEDRLLTELENTVNAARERIPGNYNQRLMDVDKAYYEKVGVPFSAQGIKDIDSRKYAEQVAPVVVKNASSFNQFRAAVGEEANVIGRNAILSEAYSKTVKDGSLNPNALRGYIKSKEKVIDEIPGLKEELTSALADDRVLKLHRDTLDQNLKAAEKRLADNFITQSIDPQTGQALPSYTQIVNGILQGQENIVTVRNALKDVDPATSKAVKKALQAEFLDKARDYPDGGMAFIKDAKNKTAVDFLFGTGTKEGYASFRQSLDNIVKLSDAVNKADITKINVQVSQKDLDSVGKFLEQQGLPGLDAPFIASTVRDRISSLFQKGVRLLSRVNQARTKDATEALLADVILDPQGRQKLQSMVNTIDLSFKNPASVKSFVDTMSDIFPRYMYGTMSAVTNEPPEEQPMDIQFGGFEE